MKNLLYIIVLITLISCHDKRFDIIQSHVETLDNTKIELKFKGLEYEDLGVITAKDSVDLLLPLFEKSLSEKLDYLNNYKSGYYGLLNTAKNGLNDRIMRDFYLEQIPYYKKQIKKDSLRNLEIINTYKTDCNDTYLEEVKKYLDKLNSDPNRVICKVAKVKYSIFNPILQTEQEINDVFLLSPDGLVVLTQAPEQTVEEHFNSMLIKFE